MANPKYKMSRSNSRSRRAHDALKVPNVIECPNCKAPALPHRLCQACGFYGGREVVKLSEMKKKKAV